MLKYALFPSHMTGGKQLQVRVPEQAAGTYTIEPGKRYHNINKRYTHLYNIS